MPEQEKYIQEERISLQDVINRIGEWINYLLSQWKQIMLITGVLSGMIIGYQTLRNPTYMAETTFVLETQSAGGMGGLSSLASVAGVDIGGLNSGNDLFQSENIIELYQSRHMLRETFLTKKEFDGKQILLIDRYADFHGLNEKWEEEENLKGLQFDIPRAEFTVSHDSLLFEVIKNFKKGNLVAKKVSRQLSIISVQVNHKDQLFAKAFNEALVENVNDFYFQTKTKKSWENLAILQKQTDSVKFVLDSAMSRLAVISENQPNINALLKTELLPIQQLQITIESSGAVYRQLVTNLELAKISHRNNSPLIQTVDYPMLPLPNDKWKLLYLLVVSVFFGGFVSIIYFTLRLIYKNLLN